MKADSYFGAILCICLSSFLPASVFGAPAHMVVLPAGVSSIQVPKSYTDLSRGTLTLTYEVLPQIDGHPAKTLIMIPGGPGNSADYLKNQAFLDLLRQKLQLILLHPRGSPKSPLSSEDMADTSINQVRNLAMDVEELRRSSLGDESVLVYGHSFGGVVGLVYAGLFPGRTAGLISHSSLANFNMYRREALQKEDFTQTSLYQVFGLALKRSGLEGELQAYKDMVSEVERQASIGKVVLNDNGDKMTLSVPDLRKVLPIFLMRPLDESKKFLRSLLEGSDFATHAIRDYLGWMESNDSPDQREVLYCSEFLTPVELDFPLVKKEGTVKSNECPKFNGRRPPSLDFDQIHKNISAPVLVLFGRYDFLVAPDLELKGFADLANVQFKELTRSTHYSYDSEPIETAQAISQFAGD